MMHMLKVYHKRRYTPFCAVVTVVANAKRPKPDILARIIELFTTFKKRIHQVY